MDPSSVAVAFVGFTASVITLSSLVINASKTLYELQDQVRNAPKELRDLYGTIKSLELVLVEIQQQVINLDQVVDSPQLLDSWKTTTSQLTDIMESFHSWLDEGFKSRDFDHIGRKQLLQRVKIFFAEKKIEAFRQSIAGYTSQLGLIQGLIITLQNQALTKEIKIVAQVAETTSLAVQELRRLAPSTGMQLRQAIESTSSSSSQTMQLLRDDILQFRQAHFSSIQTIKQTLQNLGMYKGKSQGNHNIVINSHRNFQVLSKLQSPCHAQSQLNFEFAAFNTVVQLPIGSLYYKRRRYQKSSCGRTETSGVYFTFFPARWVSKWVIRACLEFYRSREMTRTISIGLKPPGRICQDIEVIASFGFHFNDLAKFCVIQVPVIPNPANFQRYLEEGRIASNDFIFIWEFGFATILELCKILLDFNPCMDVSSTEHGSPMYIASGASLDMIYKRVDAYKEWSGVGWSGVGWNRHLSAPAAPELLSLPQLLLQHGSTFQPILPLGPNRNSWSEEHGWLPKLMKISRDPEYIRQTFFGNLDYCSIYNFDKIDQWFIALFCYTYPKIRAEVEQQLLIRNQQVDEGYPAALELSNVLEDIKAASLWERCYFIGCICRYGNLDLLRPFLQGDFDLNEYGWIDMPCLYHFSSPYICYAAKEVNLDILNALIDAGAILKSPGHVIEMFQGHPGVQCNEQSTIPFVELAFRSFDFDSCQRSYQGREPFLSKCLEKRPNAKHTKFEAVDKANCAILDGFVRRGYFNAYLPETLDSILGPETFYLACYNAAPQLLSYFLSRHKPYLECVIAYHDFLVGSPRGFTALGMAVKNCNLQNTKLLLDAGANITRSIPEGCSALDIAIINFKEYLNPTTSLYGSPEEIFNILITELRSRGEISVADQAVAEMKGELKETITEMCQKRHISKLRGLRVIQLTKALLAYFIGYNPPLETWRFYNAIRLWIRNFRVVTDVSVDGIFVRLGFFVLSSISFLVGMWKANQSILHTWRLPVFLWKVIVVSLLFLIIALQQKSAWY